MSEVDVKPDSVVSRLQGQFKRLLNATMLGDGLKTKVLRGGIWIGSGSVAEQVLRFARNMLLTRLLAPSAFGIMAIALSAASVVDNLTDVGVNTAIVQNPKGAEDGHQNTAWWMAVGRGTGLYFLVFLLAPWIARFYGNPELVPLLRVILFSVVFTSAISSGAYIAVKQMKFHRWAVINNGGAIFGVALTVILSFYMRNVWALAIGYCCESLGRCVLSFALCPFRPSLRIDKQAAKELWHFSRGMWGLGFLNLVFARTDVFVLAKLFSAAQLGLYTMAIYIVQTPTSFIMNLQGQTMLSPFSQVHEDNARTNKIFLQIASLMVLLTMPGIVFALFFGRTLLAVAYGPRYAPAAASLVVAAFVAAINLLNGQPTLIFFAKARPHLHRVCVIITSITMIVLIYPFTKYFGLAGGQLAALIAITLGFIFQLIRLHGLTHFDSLQYCKIFFQGIAISAVMAAVCLVARSYGLLTRPIPALLIGVVACLIAYGLGAGVFFRDKSKGTYGTIPLKGLPQLENTPESGSINE